MFSLVPDDLFGFVRPWRRTIYNASYKLRGSPDYRHTHATFRLTALRVPYSVNLRETPCGPTADHVAGLP